MSNEIHYNRRLKEGDFFVYLELAIAIQNSARSDRLEGKIISSETTRAKHYLDGFKREFDERMTLLRKYGIEDEALENLYQRIEELEKYEAFQLKEFSEELEPHKKILLDFGRENAPAHRGYSPQRFSRPWSTME
jgi:hypothetical protein